MARGSGLAFAGALALGVAAWGNLVEKNRFTLRHDVVPILDPVSYTHLTLPTNREV